MPLTGGGKEITMIICCCDGSVNGIFTAIYRAWEIGTSKTAISVSDGETMELFCEYRYFDADDELAAKVASTIRHKLSPDIYTQVYHAALSSCPERGDIIYHFLIDAFKVGPGIVNHLVNPYVMRLFELDRNVSRESQHFLGFIRFGQYRDEHGSFLLARFAPTNDILDLMSYHFADRLRNDNWLIADTTRHRCSIHHAGRHHYVLSDITDDYLDSLVDATREHTGCAATGSNEAIEELFETFRSSVAIEARRNEKLQQQLMPLKYRTYMNTYTNTDGVPITGSRTHSSSLTHSRLCD